MLTMREMSLVLLLAKGWCRIRPVLFPNWHGSVVFGWHPAVCCQRDVLHPAELHVVCVDAQLDCSYWWNFPQLHLFVRSRMYVSFTALILCGWSRFLCFFWVLCYFLSVNCRNFNISFSSVSQVFFFSLYSWKLIHADLPLQVLFLKLDIEYFSKPLTVYFLSELSIVSKV